MDSGTISQGYYRSTGVLPARGTTVLPRPGPIVGMARSTETCPGCANPDPDADPGPGCTAYR